ncbi:MAG: hypothetical protein ACK5UE_02415 [Chitinophagales bacterium]|jgi:C4-type Zn-finger protein
MNKKYDYLKSRIADFLKLPVVGSALLEFVDCADCDYRHKKSERIVKKGKVWTTYHCPKCKSESTCKVSQY